MSRDIFLSGRTFIPSRLPSLRSCRQPLAVLIGTHQKSLDPYCEEVRLSQGSPSAKRILTYMSIREQIQTALDAGWVVNLLPTLPSIPHWRVIFMTRRLSDELEQHLEDPTTMVRAAELLATFDTFLGGRLVTIGGRNDKHAYMKLLEPEQEEVWEIRSIDPKPSIRVFGRFAAKDVFVATNMGFRSGLGGFGSIEFRAAMTHCKREWSRCFYTWPPHKGKSVHDYISENVIDLRDL